MKQVTLLCFLTFFITFSAHAQRGSDFIEQTPPVETPLGFFSGYFDTGMVPENRFTFDLPLTGFDYGITDNFTIGTNTASTLVTSFTFNPFLFLKARYRFFSNKSISSVITGYLGYFLIPSSSSTPENTTWLINFTNNTSYFFNSNNILTFHFNTLNFSSQNGDSSDKKYFKLSLNSIAFGLGYQTFFTDRFGIEGQFLYSPYFSISYDDPGQQTSLDFNTNSQSIPFFVRILLNYKTGKESNLNFGYWNFTNLVSGPWLGWQVLF